MDMEHIGWRVGVLLTALLTAAVIVLTGCTTQQPTGKPDVPVQERAFALEAADFDATVSVPEKPVATVETSIPDVRFELYQVQRTGKAVTVVFAVHNTGDESLDLQSLAEALSVPAGVPGSLYADDVTLVDGKALKEYQPLLTEDERCLCTRVWDTVAQDELAAGNRQWNIAQVTAPPAGVDRVNVSAGSLASVPNTKIGG